MSRLETSHRLVSSSDTLVRLHKQKTHHYPRIIVILFLVFSAYMVVPLFDLPLLGLSLSAPIFYLIALPVFFRPPAPWFQQYRRWIMLAATIWLGIFFSAFGNGLLSGGANIDIDGALAVVRFGYWLLVLVVTTYFVSYLHLGQRVSAVLAGMIVVLALLRWSEAILFGKIGAWTHTTFMTQNSYGFLFSVFAPYVLIQMVGQKSFLGKAFWGIATLTLWGAVAINGSRSSWVAVTAGILGFVLIYTLANPKHLRLSLMVLLLCGCMVGLFLVVPNNIRSVLDQRYSTVQKLEEDKSFMIRQLMIQKGIRLFWESPIIGVGPSRFKKSSTALDMPRVLQYASQKHFDSKSAHNSYIDLLAETGIAGAIPFGLLLISLIIGGLGASLKLAQQGEYWGVGVFIGFLTMSVHMWSIATLTNTANWFIYGLVAAVIVSARLPRPAATLSDLRG